jgi:hypothetical protein
MAPTAGDLAATLAAVDEANFVRVVADWLSRGTVSDDAPPLTGSPVRDALVAAAVAHLARLRGVPVPRWTHDERRALPRFWHPGRDAFFAYALANSPAEFAARGILVEGGSLVSV